MAKKLHELLERLEEYRIDGPEDPTVTALIYDSRKIREGCLFVCIRGAKFDAHDRIPDAIEKKAAAVLVETIDEEIKEQCLKASVTVVECLDTRRALAVTSAAWFDHPAEKLITIGITGTKGKTTTTYLIREALSRSLCPCGLVGTIEIFNGRERIAAKNTTPESYELQQAFAEMVENKVRAVVMEVSSQGLMLHRVGGFVFDIGIFTNLSPDHIGPNEHKDFEDYLYCKSLLFRQSKIGIYNADDGYATRVMEGNTCERIYSYGIEKESDIRASELVPYRTGGHLGMRFRVTEDGKAYEREFDQPGLFSVYNFLAAYSAAHRALEIFIDRKNAKIRMEVNPSGVMDLFSDVPVPGRIETLPVSHDYTLMIDYAHNAMALESLLTTIKAYTPERIVTLFGCGGNRAKARRYEMGEVSGRLSDLTIITSDNPRDEEPMAIIEDIITGMKKTDGEYVTIPDRKEAIAYAIRNAKKGDIIILAGKGHEDYQEIKGVKHPMDERKLVAEILKEDNDTEAYERMKDKYPWIIRE